MRRRSIPLDWVRGFGHDLFSLFLSTFAPQDTRSVQPWWVDDLFAARTTQLEIGFQAACATKAMSLSLATRTCSLEWGERHCTQVVPLVLRRSRSGPVPNGTPDTGDRRDDLVLRRGLEPLHHLRHEILSLACLPFHHLSIVGAIRLERTTSRLSAVRSDH